MDEIKLRPCPFCGSRIRFDEAKENIVLRAIKVTCMGCRMTFSHEQDFAYSKTARIALNDSFEYTWNRRVGSDV